MIANKNNNKIVLSIGLGRLHFIQSAEVINKYVNKLEIIQGWVPPTYIPMYLILQLGRLCGIQDITFGLKKRKMKFLNDMNNHSIGIAEFIQQILFKLSKLNIVSNDAAMRISWTLFSNESIRYIKNQDIFHVRSGAGGKAIEFAKNNNIKVIVDQSIAHPSFMNNALKGEYEKYYIANPIMLNNSFWDIVLNDCMNADILLVNSKFVKDTFIEQGYPTSKIEVVHLGVREDFHKIKKSYRIDGNIKIIFTGHFGVRKGAVYILEAMKILEIKRIPFELIIIGSILGSEIILEKSKLKNKIYAPGYINQDKLKDYLISSDIYLFPSLAEGCAQSGMEAMAAGLPIIATRESGLPIDTGIDGIIIEAKNPERIAEEIEKLWLSQDLRTSLGNSASKKISKLYKWDDYAEGVVGIYTRLINENRNKN